MEVAIDTAMKKTEIITEQTNLQGCFKQEEDSVTVILNVIISFCDFKFTLRCQLYPFPLQHFERKELVLELETFNTHGL